MACSHKASSSVSYGGLPPIKLDLLTKWEQIKIRKVRMKRRAHRHHGLDRKLAHINLNLNNYNNVQDNSESEDDGSVIDYEDEEHMPYHSSDERDGFDPDCCCYYAFVGEFED
ncbi:hypothetical protein PG984_000747 [Apiospora sp. TS-2023a]